MEHGSKSGSRQKLPDFQAIRGEENPDATVRCSYLRSSWRWRRGRGGVCVWGGAFVAATLQRTLRWREVGGVLRATAGAAPELVPVSDHVTFNMAAAWAHSRKGWSVSSQAAVEVEVGTVLAVTEGLSWRRTG